MKHWMEQIFGIMGAWNWVPSYVLLVMHLERRPFTSLSFIFKMRLAPPWYDYWLHTLFTHLLSFLLKIWEKKKLKVVSVCLNLAPCLLLEENNEVFIFLFLQFCPKCGLWTSRPGIPWAHPWPLNQYHRFNKGPGDLCACGSLASICLGQLVIKVKG